MPETTIRGLGELQTRTLAITQSGFGGAQVRTDDQGRRIYNALAYGYYDGTDATIDTYDTCMSAGAFKNTTPDDFRVLGFHDSRTAAVGMPVGVQDTPVGLSVDFVMDQDDPYARFLESKIQGGFIRAVSVGFMPNDGYIMKNGHTICFTDCDLHELSLVNTPSSKQALIDLSRELGKDEADVRAMYADVLRDATPVEEIRDLALELMARLDSVRAELVLALGEATTPDTTSDDTRSGDVKVTGGTPANETTEPAASVPVVERTSKAREALRRLSRF